MKKIYTALCGCLLVVLLLMGLVAAFDINETYSETEGRYLAAKPKLSLAGILDGSYAAAYRAYFSDTFPSREALLEDYDSWDWFYTFGTKETEPVETEPPEALPPVTEPPISEESDTAPSE